MAKCPVCGRTWVRCPECGKTYPHAERSHCSVPSCKEVNAPLDCAGCGRVVSNDLRGVLDFDMKLVEYAE